MAWYGRSGRCTSHSASVRLLPAIRHARVSHEAGSTSQIHPDPESETTIIRLPSGVNDAASQPLGSGPGKGPPRIAPVPRSHIRISPALLAAMTVRPSGLMSTVSATPTSPAREGLRPSPPPRSTPARHCFAPGHDETPVVGYVGRPDAEVVGVDRRLHPVGCQVPIDDIAAFCETCHGNEMLAIGRERKVVHRRWESADARKGCP